MDRKPPMQNQIQMLDQMYRQESGVYDLAREYYLMGTDRLLGLIHCHPADRVLDWGCGTGRSLINLARRYPHSQFFGVESATELVTRALSAINRRNLEPRVTICESHLDDVDPRKALGLRDTEQSASWDVVYFNYSLSGLPHWKVALAVALDQLKPGKSLYVCDFWDGKQLPHNFHNQLAQWYDKFDIHPNNEVLPHLEELALNGMGSLLVRPVASRFAFLAKLTKARDHSANVAATTAAVADSTINWDDDQLPSND